MKKIAFIVFLVTLAMGSILAARSSYGSFRLGLGFRDSVRGSGNSQTETRNVAGFEAIKANGVVNVEVSAQKDFSVQVEADDNLLQYIKTEANNGTLKIYSEGNISPKSKIIVRISMPTVNGLEINGASNASVSNVKSDSLKLKANGASKIKIDGEAKMLESDANGASTIDAEALKVEIADVDANGASKTIVSATNELKANASGASGIYYTGEPQNVVSKNSGASSIRRK